MAKKLELENQTFNKLTVISKAESKHRRSRWLCQCECGNFTTVYGGDLKAGNIKSCGCSQGQTHGLSNTKEYKTWLSIKARCNNPKHSTYNYYGGNNISICKEWEEDFEQFYKHVGPAPSNSCSIDRIDSSKNYEPGNVRWVEDYSIQNINRRTPKNNTSGVKGVSWYPKYNKWIARINVNKKRISLGYFENFDDAVKARKEAELKYYEYKKS